MERLVALKIGNRNKGKGNGAGLALESRSHYFADEFGHTHMTFPPPALKGQLQGHP